MHKPFIISLGMTFAIACSAASAQGNAYDNAVGLYNKGQFQPASLGFEKLVKGGKADANTYYYLASTYQKLGKYDLAKKMFENTVAKYPNTPAGGYARQALINLSQPAVRTAAIATTNTTTAATGISAVNTTGGANGENLPAEDRIPIKTGHSGHILVQAQVNGRTLDAMFDTGAESCAMSVAQWCALGLPKPNRDPDSGIAGVGGVEPAWTVEAPMSLGKFKRNTKWLISEGFGTTPLIGQTFFKDLQVNLERRSGYVHLVRAGSARRDVPYNTMDVPFEKAGNNMLVTVKINGDPIQMYFDTGADGVAMSMMHFHLLGLKFDDQTMVGTSHGAGGSSVTYMTKVHSIELGDIRKYNFPIAVLENFLPHPLLGQSFFGDRRYVIDNEAKMIRFFR